MAACTVTLVLLIYESIVDVRWRKIDVRAAAFVCIFNIITGIVFYKYQAKFIVLGAATGVFLILCARIMRERIGYGDGIIFVVIGMCMEPVKVIGVLWCSMLLAGVYGVVKILVFKKGRNYALPFVPFVTVVYAAVFIMTVYQGRECV